MVCVYRYVHHVHTYIHNPYRQVQSGPVRSRLHFLVRKVSSEGDVQKARRLEGPIACYLPSSALPQLVSFPGSLPRWGWLQRCVSIVRHTPCPFERPDGRLGVVRRVGGGRSSRAGTLGLPARYDSHPRIMPSHEPEPRAHCVEVCRKGLLFHFSLFSRSAEHHITCLNPHSGWRSCRKCLLRNSGGGSQTCTIVRCRDWAITCHEGQRDYLQFHSCLCMFLFTSNGIEEGSGRVKVAHRLLRNRWRGSYTAAIILRIVI